jgi:hypothetical protein
MMELRPTKPVSSRLYRFFDWLIRRTFQDLGIREPTVAQYIAELLAEFARTDNLYRIDELQGERLETVVEMLLAAQNLEAEGPALVKEREIYKHTGDYILFMSGLFREYVEKNAFRGYYLREGQRVYGKVFDMDIMLHRPGFLFHELAKKFEFYSGAVHYMRKTFFVDRPSGSPFADFSRQLEILV